MSFFLVLPSDLESTYTLLHLLLGRHTWFAFLLFHGEQLLLK